MGERARDIRVTIMHARLAAAVKTFFREESFPYSAPHMIDPTAQTGSHSRTLDECLLPLVVNQGR